MVQKLDKDEYLIYEKYRGLILTPKGTQMGKRLLERHALLESFLSIIGVDPSHIYHDVEGIEHHLSWNSIDRIGDVVQFLKIIQMRLRRSRQWRRRNQKQRNNGNPRLRC